MARHPPTQHIMVADEFYQWLEARSERYQLVDGQPVMMAGASIAHDTIVMNASRVFGNQLLNKPCRPRSADIAVKISEHNIRYPDLTVDCGSPNNSARESEKPTLVIEVASKSTKDFDEVDKLEEYKAIPSIQYILLVATDRARVRFFYRDEDGKWENRASIGMESRIDLSYIGVSISLGDLYYGLSFDSNPENWLENDAKPR